MNKLNNKSGFTLIEIIVVLIIVGILAAIALPNLFSNVTKSRSAEALNIMETMKAQIEACQQGRPTSAAADCIFAGAGGITDPTNTNFTYKITTPPSNNVAQTGAGGQTYTLTAQSGFDGGNDTITMVRTTGATVTCTGAGNFVGVC